MAVLCHYTCLFNQYAIITDVMLQYQPLLLFFSFIRWFSFIVIFYLIFQLLAQTTNWRINIVIRSAGKPQMWSNVWTSAIQHSDNTTIQHISYIFLNLAHLPQSFDIKISQFNNRVHCARPIASLIGGRIVVTRGALYIHRTLHNNGTFLYSDRHIILFYRHRQSIHSIIQPLR